MLIDVAPVVEQQAVDSPSVLLFSGMTDTIVDLLHMIRQRDPDAAVVREMLGVSMAVVTIGGKTVIDLGTAQSMTATMHAADGKRFIIASEIREGTAP